MELGKHRDEWQKLCDTRVKAAEILLTNERYDAAYYLAGYAVECALKARIVKLLEGYFPPKQNLYIHGLVKLLDAAELVKAFEDKSKTAPTLAAQWNIVKDWTEDSRYESQGPEKATSMLEAVRGVVECIRQYW